MTALCLSLSALQDRVIIDEFHRRIYTYYVELGLLSFRYILGQRRFDYSWKVTSLTLR